MGNRWETGEKQVRNKWEVGWTQERTQRPVPHRAALRKHVWWIGIIWGVKSQTSVFSLRNKTQVSRSITVMTVDLKN